MSKILKLAASIFLVIALCFTFTLDNAVSAATKQSAQDKKAMRLFRQSLIATTGDSNKILRQFFIFLMPEVQAELAFNGKINGHTLELAGNLGFWLTGNDGKVTDMDTPFYIKQNGNNMEFYYKSNDNWMKYSAPTIAATLTDVVTSPTREEIDKQIAMVKSVEILQDNDSRSILLVRLDGEKLAEELKLTMKDESDDKESPEVLEMQSKFLTYLENGLRKSDLWYTWKIDKKNQRTGAITFDLSPIIHETAFEILNDPSNKDLPDEFKELLEMIAYYSELKTYTTFLGPEAESSLIVPQEVIDSAKPAEDLVPEASAK